MQNAVSFTPQSTPIAYNDLLLRICASLLGAHLIVAYGETYTLFQMLTFRYYYYALIPSFLIALILFSTIRALTKWLDRKYDWTKKTPERLVTQVIFGLVLPAVAAFLLAFLYFTIRCVDVFTTTYFKYDFQFILLQLLIINLYYIIYYFYQKWAHAEKTVHLLSSKWSAAGQPTRTTFQVSKAAQHILVDIDGIAYFFRKGETNYLRTIGKEDYFVNMSLDEVQQQLPEDIFFRANRQLIVHRNSVKRFDLLTHGKLEAIIDPPFTDTIISSRRAAAFRKWIDRG